VDHGDYGASSVDIRGDTTIVRASKIGDGFSIEKVIIIDRVGDKWVGPFEMESSGVAVLNRDDDGEVLIHNGDSIDFFRRTEAGDWTEYASVKAGNLYPGPFSSWGNRALFAPRSGEPGVERVAVAAHRVAPCSAASTTMPAQERGACETPAAVYRGKRAHAFLLTLPARGAH
jgi:hypothetical protein